MKYQIDETGRLPEKPKYSQKELNNMAEDVLFASSDILGQNIQYPIPTDKLTVIIERYVDDLDLYADLEKEYGDKNIEGVTIFLPFKKPVVRISEKLQKFKFKENRLRTTLAHELGHVIIHNPLWQREFSKLQLPFDTTEKRIQICKRKTLFSKDEPNYEHYDWIEWQANYFGSALLMPKKALHKFYKIFTTERGIRSQISDESSDASDLISMLSQAFQLSNEAVRVRLKQMKILVSQEDITSSPTLF